MPFKKINYKRKRPILKKKFRGFNKTEIKQAKTIAKNVLMKAAESKYFACLSMDSLTNDGEYN